MQHSVVTTVTKELSALAGLPFLVSAAAALVVPTDTVGLDAALQAAKAGDTTPSATLNAVSMNAIEKSFLNVPRVCKDRSASFDPVRVGRAEKAPAAALEIHDALGTSELDLLERENGALS